MTTTSLVASSVAAVATPPSGTQAAATVYTVSFAKVSDGSAVTTFIQPVALTFTYTNADVSGINPATLQVYRWDGSSWHVLPSTVDTTGQTVTATTIHFSTFALLGTPSTTPSPPPASGGGGGAGTFPTVTSVIFSGRAYPSSTVTLLKDAQIAATTVSGGEAKFQFTLTGLTGGTYLFSLYSEDGAGRRSSLLTFPVSVTEGATTNVSGIFIAPTIDVDKSTVKQGDNLAIFGRTSPTSQVTISVSSNETFVKTTSDAQGAYLYNLDTVDLEMGLHHTKSKSTVASEISSYSSAIAFEVGTTNTPKGPARKCIIADVNCDGHVNLIDFSIVAYWYRRPTPPTVVDLNSDGRVDLVDFSIMAFYWTG